MKKLLFFVLLLLNYQSPILAKCIKGDCQNGPGIYDDSKGNKYIGNFKDGDRHGEGSMTWDVGDTYKGQWVNNKMHGKGTYKTKLLTYTGNFTAGIIEGQGTAKYTNGATYVGEWKNNNRHGQGTIIDNKGNKFTGQFINNKQGKGVFTKAITKTKIKDCVKGNCENGFGKRIYKNGVYEGNFKNTLRHGKGSYAWKNGNKFVGEWIKGKGVKGTFEYKKSGDIYTGDFKRSNFSKHGFGKIVIKSTGEIRNGLWCYNKYIGNDPGFKIDTCIKVLEAKRKQQQERQRERQAAKIRKWDEQFKKDKINATQIMKKAQKCYSTLNKVQRSQASTLWGNALIDFNRAKKFEISKPSVSRGLYFTSYRQAQSFMNMMCRR
ncbi:MAG: MORN repeat-containing protein [Pelagibacteraceae bacterium]